MNVTCKYTRGSVWYGVDTSTKDKHFSTDHLQRGNRLFVVFSSDAGNVTSPNVSVIPLSTQTQKKLSINIPVKGYDGVEQIALCNMLQPIPKENLIEYRYSLSEQTMQKIEHGVLISNDMETYITKEEVSYTFDQLISAIEGIVKHRVDMILDDERKKVNKVTAVDISNMVENLMKDVDKETAEKIEKSHKKSGEDFVEDVLSQENDKLRKNEGGRRVWTADKCRLFILDRETKGKNKTAQLWGIKPTSVQTTYFNCKKRLTDFR